MKAFYKDPAIIGILALIPLFVLVALGQFAYARISNPGGAGITVPVSRANGGTATSTNGVPGGVMYDNGTVITNNANFTVDGNGNATLGSGGNPVMRLTLDPNNNNALEATSSGLTYAALTIQTTGNVGIGATSTPDALLSAVDVQGYASVAPHLDFDLSSSTIGTATTSLFNVLSTGAVTLPQHPSAFALLSVGTNGGANGNIDAINISDGRSGLVWDGGNSAIAIEAASGKAFEVGVNMTAPSYSIAPNLFISGGSPGLGTAGSVGIGTSSPVANFQVANGVSTTSISFGSKSHIIGTCWTFYRDDGTPVYITIASGATSFSLTTTKPSGCQD